MRNAELVQDKDSITLLDKDVQQCPYHAYKKAEGGESRLSGPGNGLSH